MQKINRLHISMSDRIAYRHTFRFYNIFACFRPSSLQPSPSLETRCSIMFTQLRNRSQYIRRKSHNLTLGNTTTYLPTTYDLRLAFSPLPHNLYKAPTTIPIKTQIHPPPSYTAGLGTKLNHPPPLPDTPSAAPGANGKRFNLPSLADLDSPPFPLADLDNPPSSPPPTPPSSTHACRFGTESVLRHNPLFATEESRGWGGMGEVVVGSRMGLRKGGLLTPNAPP